MKFMRRNEVVEATGIPTSTIYEMMSAGKFPRPVKITPRLVAWPSQEIEDWQATKIAERDQAAA